MKKCYEINIDICVFLQLQLTLIHPGLPNLATLLFNRPIRGLFQRISMPPIMYDNDKRNHAALKQAFPSNSETDIHINMSILPTG